jgi:GT2 family glycosyltransferase
VYTRPLVSIVIVTQNRKAELKRCLQAVYAQHHGQVETLVIDNKSMDGTPGMVTTEFPGVHLIRLDRNLGCPGARNVGVLNAHGDIIFFLDDDCIIDVDAVDNALPYFESDERLVVVSPQIIEPEQDRTLPRMSISARYSHEFTGVSAIRRTVFEHCGLYPVDFLYGAEESDLALRILNADGHILYAPDVKVFHYPAKNRNRNWEMEQRLLNAMRVLVKYAPALRLLAGILVKPLTFLPMAIRQHSLWGWIKAVVRIPGLVMKTLISGQRTPLGWKPFLMGEFLMSNAVTSLEELSQVDGQQIKAAVRRSGLTRLFISKWL